MDICQYSTQAPFTFRDWDPANNCRQPDPALLYENLFSEYITVEFQEHIPVADASYYRSNEEVTGCGKHMFLCMRDTMDILLGSPRILKNDTAYWSCRKQWLIHVKKHTLSRYTDMCHDADVSRSPKLTFSTELDIIMIPPKEGEDFDVDAVTEKEYPNIKLLSGPLKPVDDYIEFWTESPFPSDKGAQRPYFHNKKGEGPSGWCLCKKPPHKQPDGVISCMKCLNHEVRKCTRKSTAEQFHQQYLKNAGHVTQ